jgi:signal peptidase II
MQQFKRMALIATMLIACVGCDQTSKSLAREHLQGHAITSYFGDTLRLQYAENPGAFLSLGESMSHRWRAAVFTVGVGIVVASVLVFVIRAETSSAIQTLALTLICGGGIGNLIDRVRYDGYVTDFISVGVGSIRTGIFNIADVVLMIGIALFIWQTRVKRPQDRGRTT